MTIETSITLSDEDVKGILNQWLTNKGYNVTKITIFDSEVGESSCKQRVIVSTRNNEVKK